MNPADLALVTRRRARRWRTVGTTFAPPSWRRSADDADAYTELFVAPRPLVYPYASMYAPCPRVMGDSTVDVARRYAAARFRVCRSWRELPDHVALELRFMSTLAAREAREWRRNEAGAARRLASVERAFLEDHLLSWIPRFCDAVAREEPGAAFRPAAERLRWLLARDHDWLLALTAEAG